MVWVFLRIAVAAMRDYNHVDAKELRDPKSSGRRYLRRFPFDIWFTLGHLDPGTIHPRPRPCSGEKHNVKD